MTSICYDSFLSILNLRKHSANDTFYCICTEHEWLIKVGVSRYRRFLCESVKKMSNECIVVHKTSVIEAQNKNARTLEADLETGHLHMRWQFTGSSAITSHETRCPMYLNAGLQNSHFFEFSFKPARWNSVRMLDSEGDHQSLIPYKLSSR